MLMPKNKIINNVWIEGKQLSIDLSNKTIDGYKKIDDEYSKFNGYKYERLFRSITCFSLLNTLTNDQIIKSSNLIKKYIDIIKKHNCETECLSLQEICDFQEMLDIYGKAGSYLHSWY